MGPLVGVVCVWPWSHIGVAGGEERRAFQKGAGRAQWGGLGSCPGLQGWQQYEMMRTEGRVHLTVLERVVRWEFRQMPPDFLSCRLHSLLMPQDNFLPHSLFGVPLDLVPQLSDLLSPLGSGGCSPRLRCRTGICHIY